ncbi:FHA domain-containing protein [Vibrio europaeus]|uniref:FHA domain-containing protein n=1 Tax=Vibrio europaeus TaxID=300876 RepID=A0A178JEG9_9VIBR|nr:type VI secretion system-associated FHA domain protein [Vibrio europaeus]MDC5707745.1 FHA domain-containing protein [Vibrio europaeus]MDC5709991.1 FHA domain-containing protein [Vibrio europaeus]MDC5715081.1 FHA domain-containing protein [Vibrio europaeus]MDC5722849.1 FHA domain-containing protein [Vibrio europaeus]MDC5726817.1 FHA domain-containing protein [Vibrio europaeus]
MAVSIHLISVPTEEVVASRVVYLPESGGTLGRAPACDICLPDQSKRISRTHGEVRLTDRGYVLISRGQNCASLNDKVMVRDKEYPLNDGDIIKVENYTMLVSTLVSSSAEAPQQDDDDFLSQPFELNLNDDETEFLEQTEAPKQKQNGASFSHKNVLSDDPFASDPFEDLDSDEIAAHVEVDEVAQTKTFEQATDLEYLPVDTPNNNTQLEASIEKLLTLSEKNQQYLQNPMLHHDALFDALEKTVDQFLNEFAPKELENQFSEYLSGGLFSNKEKKYWKIYRKHFQHRQQNGDFRRQFKALFLENMQKQREEG